MSKYHDDGSILENALNISNEEIDEMCDIIYNNYLAEKALNEAKEQYDSSNVIVEDVFEDPNLPKGIDPGFLPGFQIAADADNETIEIDSPNSIADTVPGIAASILNSVLEVQ